MLAHNVASLAQRLGDCHAVRAGRHAADKRISVFVVFIDIKLHARNRVAVCPIGFGQADKAFGRLILDFQLAGFEVSSSMTISAEKPVSTKCSGTLLSVTR